MSVYRGATFPYILPLGRTLRVGDVYFGEEHINTWLIEQRFAVKYDGGTKVIPLSWMDYHLGSD